MNVTIRRPNVSELPAMKNLWRNVFHDSKEYVDHFFSASDPTKTGLCAFEDNVLASMMFSLPSVLSVNGVSYDAKYLYAVATDYAYRNYGIMTVLEKEAARIAKEEGSFCMVLVPANLQLFKMYEKLGYRTCFWLGVSELAPYVLPEAQLLPCTAEEFLLMRKDMLRQTKSYFDLHDCIYEYRFHEFIKGDRDIFKIITPYGCGYLLGYRQDDHYKIIETSLTGKALFHAAGELKVRYKLRKVHIISRYGARFPFGMIKCLNNKINNKTLINVNPYMNMMLN